MRKWGVLALGAAVVAALAFYGIERVFEPVKVNYDILGNSVPHLHVHVIPRYADDPRPEWPFPFPAEEPPPFPDAELRADVEQLRAAARGR